jgi:hypothetical protein
VAAVALATFICTNRRWPDRTVDAAAPSRMQTGLLRLVARHAHQDPEAEAGFFFALQTLARSGPHRTILAVAAAVGLTHASIVLAHTGRLLPMPSSPPPGVLAISPVLLASLLMAVRYAVTLPAAPGANGSIRLAWQGDERPYLAGVKRAAMLLATLASALLFPMHVAWLGPRPALVHSALALLFATAALHALFLGYRKLPFACGYVPVPNPKLTWPGGLIVLLFVTYGLANAEHWALNSTTHTVGLAAALCGIAFATITCDRHRRVERPRMVFDERPSPATQRLGLSDHLLGYD